MTRHLHVLFWLTLVASLTGAAQDAIIARTDGSSSTQPSQTGAKLAPLAPEEARKAAQALIGKTLEKLAFYYSLEDGTNYLAFSVREDTDRGWGHELRLYKQVNGGFTELWRQTIEMMNLFQFKLELLPGDKYPSLCFAAAMGGSGGATQKLGLYSVEVRRPYGVEFHEDYDATPYSIVTEKPDEAPDAKVLVWLRSWARELGVVKDIPLNPNLDDPDNMEEAWVKDNGHMRSGLVKLRYYERLPSRYASKPSGNTTTGVISDGRYNWRAFFRSGVVGYDHERRRYFMVYLPEYRSASIEKLAVWGRWVYMSSDCFSMKVFSAPVSAPYKYSDADCKWTQRFNKETHELQQGDFSSAVQANSVGPQPSQATHTPRSPAPAQQNSVQQHIYIPPGFDASEGDRDTRRRNLAKIVLANPDLYDKLSPLQRAITICDASDLDRADHAACLQRAVLDEQRRHADAEARDADFLKRFLNVPHPTVGETRKILHDCKAVLWLDEHRSRGISLPRGTEVVITWVSGDGNSEGKVSSGEYAGKSVLFMDSDLAPEGAGQK